MSSRYASFDEYGLRHFANHLARAKRWPILAELLTDLDFLETKTGRLGLDEALRDLRTAIRRVELTQNKKKYSEILNILGLLDREADKFSDWNPEDDSIRFAQQYVYGIQKWNMSSLLSPTLKWLESKNRAVWSLRWIGDLETRALKRTLFADPGSRLVTTPNGKWLILGIGTDLQFWDIETWQLERNLPLSGIKGLALTPDGQHLVVVDDSFLQFLELGTWKLEHRSAIQGMTRLLVTPDGKKAIAVSESALQLLDMETREFVETIPGSFDTDRPAVATAGGRRVIFQDMFSLTLLDLSTGERKSIGEGHQSRLTAFAVTPDGRQAVTASADKTLTVWNLSTGEKTFKLEGHTDIVASVVITSDGKRVISGGQDAALKMWDLQSGELESNFRAHSQSINHLVIAPQGDRVASIGGVTPAWGEMEEQPARIVHSSIRDVASEAIVWDSQARRPEFFLKGQVSEALVSTFTPDGARLILGFANGSILVWNLYTEPTTAGPQPKTDRMTVKLYAALARWRSRWTDRFAQRLGRKVFNVSTLLPEHRFAAHAGGITQIIIVSDNKHIISRGTDSTIKIWQLDGDPNSRAGSGHENEVVALALVPGNRHIISAGVDATLRVWDVNEGKLEATLAGHQREITALTVTPDGQRVLSTSKDATVRVWHLTERHLAYVFDEHEAIVTDIVVTEDGRFAVSVSLDDTILIWDVATGRVAKNIRLPESSAFMTPNALVLAPGGRYIVAFSRHALSMSQMIGIGLNEDAAETPIIDLSTGEIVNYLGLMKAIKFTPDGRYGIMAVRANLKLIDFWADEVGYTSLAGHDEYISSIAVAPGSDWIASGSEDKTIGIWNLKAGQLVNTLSGHSGGVDLVEITSDGKYLISAGKDQTVRVWDAVGWEQKATIMLEGRPTCLQVIPENGASEDPPRIVVGDNTGRVYCLKYAEFLTS